MFCARRESTCEDSRQYDDGKPTPRYAATPYRLWDADSYPRNKGESPSSSLDWQRIFQISTKLQITNYKFKRNLCRIHRIWKFPKKRKFIERYCRNVYLSILSAVKHDIAQIYRGTRSRKTCYEQIIPLLIVIVSLRR